MPSSYDTVLLDLFATVQHGFGELREGQKQNRITAEERAHHLERKIQEYREEIKEHRAETKAELKEIRTDMRRIQSTTSPSSTNLYGTLGTIFKVLEAIYTNWPRIVWVLTAVAAIWGVKNPDILKVLTQAKP
jgi:uncharacterized membrane-anchored protein YhcB (DUF1043 family)